ncbi:MAG: hypothetical protein M1571_09345 [Firmicutes bacterium]|nr:hypothetical protein [Bacillota bacterium]
MKNIFDAEKNKLPVLLENLELPEVQTPAHQRHLRESLLASSYFKEGAVQLSTRQKIGRFIAPGFTLMKPKAWRLVVSLAVLFLALGAYRAFFVAPQAVASLTLQVNPGITMTISARNKVLDAEALDAPGEALLTRLDVAGKEVPEVLRLMAGALREAGLLAPERRIVVALYAIEEGLRPAERLTPPELSALTENVRQSLLGYMLEQGLPVEVKVAEVTAELDYVARAIGLLPIDYVDYVAEAGYPLAKEVLKLQKELGIDPALFKEQLGTIRAALVDIRKAGIESQIDALAILKVALAADPKLQKLTTITAAMMDLAEKGLSKETALAKIQAAIKTDPTLQNFDDLLELPEKEADEATENGTPPPEAPQRDTPRPVTPEADAPLKEADDAENGAPPPDTPPDKPEESADDD